jgi:hypothetical protein
MASEEHFFAPSVILRGSTDTCHVKVHGQWFFSRRKTYNEGSERWQYKGGVNPAW